MPRWHKAELDMLRELRVRHSADDIARAATNLPGRNGKAGRPARHCDDVTVNALDFFRAVLLKLEAGATVTRAYGQVAKEARSRGLKISERTVRALCAEAERWINENPDTWRSKMRVLWRFYTERGQSLVPALVFRRPK
jgi:hypothetical protein